MNDQRQILMVLQGKPEEEKKWSVPSGGKLPNETYEACCIREVWEETGLHVEIEQEIYVKRNDVIVHYFKVNIVGGSLCIQDPDELIYEIAWKSRDELKALQLSFEEDRELLMNLLIDSTYNDGNEKESVPW